MHKAYPNRSLAFFSYIIFLPVCTSLNQVIDRERERGGGEEEREFNKSQLIELIQAFRPAKTEETVIHRQNNKLKEVGTPPVRSNLCTPLTAVSTAMRSKVTRTVSKKQGTTQLQDKQPSKEQLSSETSNPAMRTQLHLPALDLS